MTRPSLTSILRSTVATIVTLLLGVGLVALTGTVWLPITALLTTVARIYVTQKRAADTVTGWAEGRRAPTRAAAAGAVTDLVGQRGAPCRYMRNHLSDWCRQSRLCVLTVM